jgi:UDP-GlcNAc3NAcA epimerase
VKAAAVSRQLRTYHEEILVHTGQHYDYAMSGVFFEGLDLPPADVNLGVGSGSHAAQTAAMLTGLEEIVLTERPDWMLIYGDTNSTLAGALAAAKLHVAVAHVEAGLRSFNRSMPEEINRIVADHLSSLLLCPSHTAVRNLAAEGITNHVHDVGDVMLDVLNWARERSSDAPGLLRRFAITEREYLIVTLHRSENTDDASRLASIVDALNAVDEPIVFPVHPRTRKAIGAAGLQLADHVRVTEPFSYREMVALASLARLVVTDSGGLQKEAYWLGVPCVTVRQETEWVETVDAGWNVLVGADKDRIVRAIRDFEPPRRRLALYGDGAAADRCIGLLDSSNGSRSAMSVETMKVGASHE